MSVNYERLKEIKINDFIFIIYIVLSITAIICNNIEEKNIKNGEGDTKIISSIRTAIVIVGILIYIYFTYTSYQNVKNPNKNTNEKDKKANNYVLLSSILFLIGSIIILYVNLLNTNEKIDFF